MKQCLVDACSVQFTDEVISQACHALAAYATECSRNGVVLEKWWGDLNNSAVPELQQCEACKYNASKRYLFQSTALSLYFYSNNNINFGTRG